MNTPIASVAVTLAVSMAALSVHAKWWYNNHDLADPEQPISAGDVFNQNPNATLTLTLSKDLSVPSFSAYTQQGTEIIFDFTDGGHTLLPAGWYSENHDTDTSRSIPRAGYVIWRNGTWDFVNASMCVPCGRYGYYFGGCVTILDGVSVRNTKDVYAVCDTSYGGLVLTNGADLACSGDLYLFFDTKANGGVSNRVEMSTGSRLTVPADKKFYFDTTTGAAYNPDARANTMLVTGAGTFLGAGGATVGAKIAGCELKFDDHAAGSFESLTVGSSTSGSGARIILDHGAELTNKSSVLVGPYSSNCRMEILNGARLHLASGCDLSVGTSYGGVGNQLIISNATVKARDICFGACAGGLIRVMGPRTVLDLEATSGTTPIYGTSNTFVYASCTNLMRSANAHYFVSSDNAFILEDGAKYVGSTFYAATRTTQCERQRIVIGDRCHLHSSSQFMMMGKDCVTVISNGLLEADNEYALYIGYTEDGVAHEVGGNALVFQGSNPKFRSASDNAWFQIEGDSRLHFDLPEDGYLETPIIAKRVGFSAASSITFTGAEKARKTSPQDIVLADASKGGSAITLPQAVLDRANEELAGNGYLRLTSNDTKLVLHLKGNGGLMLLFR